jgi:luciferase-type oxidoreductase
VHVTAIAAHPGFDSVFGRGAPTLGLFFAIEAYQGAVPTMQGQIELARRAEDVGFAALWFRDVPLLDPSFGDAGQVYDPWVYLGHVAAQTSSVALATGGVVLPLRHPLDVAKAAASVDVLSSGRMLLGLSGGDRPVEYPAYGVSHSRRAERFRDSVGFLEAAHDTPPRYRSDLGSLTTAVDLLPKPTVGRLPLLAVGRAGQDLDWLAGRFDAYVTYPRAVEAQRRAVDEWRAACAALPTPTPKPFAQSLYIDLVADAGRPATAIHLGYRLGWRALAELLLTLGAIGVDHIVLNLKYGSRPASQVIEDIGDFVIPALRDGAPARSRSNGARL